VNEKKRELTEPVTHKELLAARPICEVNVGCPSVSSTSNPVEYWVSAICGKYSHHNDNQAQNHFPKILHFQQPNSPRAQVLAEWFKKHIHMHISCVKAPVLISNSFTWHLAEESNAF